MEEYLSPAGARHRATREAVVDGSRPSPGRAENPDVMRDENPQLTDDEHTHNIHHRRGYVRRYHSNAAPDTGVRRIQYEALLPAS